jgi:tetratricopeptide (TPR) repeat protein
MSKLGGEILEGDDEDRPPLVEFCVGREAELQRLKDSQAKVAFITGIGGQGKSTLAAQYFADSRARHSYSYFVWRDCKEESERFENQLASVVETLSGGRISGRDLAKQDAQSIVQLLMTLTEDINVLFVFDNVDHYVNLDALQMTASPNLLIQALMSSQPTSKLVLTCRPSVEYAHPAALSVHLEGLSLDATRHLFSERGAICNDREIADAHQQTNGHAFWLDLLSIQVKKHENVTLGKLVDRIRSEKGELPEKTLNSLWATLKDREQLVLRTMAETVRPETEREIAGYLQNQLTYQKVIKALSSLRAMNLVVVKRRPAADDVLELHPLVRQFIRQSFSRPERSTFIAEIIKAYIRFIGKHRSELSARPSFTTLQYWTQTAELEIAAGRINDAFFMLDEAATAFRGSGYSREFTRAVRLLLSSIDWIAEHNKYKTFDDVFHAQVETLGYLGEYTEVDKLLESYELTVSERDSRYIRYCDMKCYSKWMREEFPDAVKWGEKGQTFSKSSHVDTQYSVEHNLALARRDAGYPELALPIFLGGRSLTEVIDPDELDESKFGHHYGNIGRCLHFMGRVDSALICYQKSALLIERGWEGLHILNQGFIRRWIGELMVAKGQYRLAAIFLEAARLKWEQVSPPRASQIVALQRHFKDELPHSLELSDDQIESICRDWILGRYMDA